MIERFIEYVEVEKRYAPNTVVSYTRDLSDFADFLLKTEGHQHFENADKKIVRNFMVHLNQKNLSKRTINRKLSTLRSFYLFLVKVGDVAVSPLETVQSLKFYAEKQIPFSEEEMMQAKCETLKPDQPRNLLKELIIEVLYQTGMRRNELTGLLIKDVDFEKLELRVTGKGNKVRLIPIAPGLAENLQSYLPLRQPSAGYEQFFFISPRGNKLTDKFVYLAVNSYLSLVTSKKKKSPHILRHSFATHVLEHGAEISKVKAILGHASLASTQVYTAANIDQLKKVFNQAHPRAKKK